MFSPQFNAQHFPRERHKADDTELQVSEAISQPEISGQV